MRTGKREQKTPRKSAGRKALMVIAVILVVIVAAYLFLVYTTNPFVTKWRTLYIETAMTTMSHKWLATAFIPHDVVQAVVDHSAQMAAQQETAVSTWDSVDPSAQASPAPVTNPVQPAPKPGTPVYAAQPDTVPAEKPGADDELEASHQQAAQLMQDSFYAIYDELDPETFEAFLAEHPGYYEDGYAGIDIEDLDWKHGLTTVYDERILALDVPNNLLLLEITDTNYVGKLAIVKNARQVYLEPSPSIGGTYGTLIEEFSAKYNGLVCINAAGFYDPEGEGWGGLIVGNYVAHDVNYTRATMPGYKCFGYRDDYRMYIENTDTYDKDNYLWAMQFSPALIIDGELVVEGSYGYGLQPRSAVGQTADGDFLLLTVDGRQVGYSIGCTVEDCGILLQKHNAYQAINLDGGSSTVMTYKGQLITKPSSVGSTGRHLPNAFVVHYADDIPAA